MNETNATIARLQLDTKMQLDRKVKILATGLLSVQTLSIQPSSDELKLERQERSAWNMIKLARLLMDGKLLRTVNVDNGVKYIYLKYGGRTRAKDEFYSVKPRNVRIENMGQLHIGEIGNRHIVLDLQAPIGRPTITITKSSKGETIVDEIRFQKNQMSENIEPLIPWH